METQGNPSDPRRIEVTGMQLSPNFHFPDESVQSLSQFSERTTSPLVMDG